MNSAKHDWTVPSIDPVKLAQDNFRIAVEQDDIEREKRLAIRSGLLSMMAIGATLLVGMFNIDNKSSILAGSFLFFGSFAAYVFTTMYYMRPSRIHANRLIAEKLFDQALQKSTVRNDTPPRTG